jgi:hypothetical protein
MALANGFKLPDYIGEEPTNIFDFGIKLGIAMLLCKILNYAQLRKNAVSAVSLNNNARELSAW